VILGVRWNAVELGVTMIFIGVVGFLFWRSIGIDGLRGGLIENRPPDMLSNDYYELPCV
jgi:hypothetical protein